MSSVPGRPASVHPIEAESYRIMAERLRLTGWPSGPAEVARRVVHATADPSLVEALVVGEAAVAAGIEAVSIGAPVVCDTEMVRAGISLDACCHLEDTGALRETERGGQPSGEHRAHGDVGATRTATALRRGLERHRTGAIVVVGSAPTALQALNELMLRNEVHPSLVVGVPVGFVGAARAKDDLLAVAAARGVPAITLRGDRGGAAVAAAVVNALARMVTTRSQRGGDQAQDRCIAGAGALSGSARQPPALLLIGHGSRSPEGEAELQAFAAAVGALRPEVTVRAGCLEFTQPAVDEAADALETDGAADVVAVPLVLLAAGHLKDDGPAALARARVRHPGTRFRYARDLGVHPIVLDIVSERVAQAGDSPDAVVVVGRGSTDPDANSELVKAARLLADGRKLTRALAPAPPAPLGFVEPCFVSLANPDLPTTLDRCYRLGARRITVVPYFLFTGVLVERIIEQARRWSGAHPASAVVLASHLGLDRRLVQLVWDRYDEATNGYAGMNCDCCLYRRPLPGYEHRMPGHDHEAAGHDHEAAGHDHEAAGHDHEAASGTESAGPGPPI